MIENYGLRVALGPHIVITEASKELLDLLTEKGKQIRTPEHDYTSKLAGRIEDEFLYENPDERLPPLFNSHIQNYIGSLPNGRTRDELDTLDTIVWDLDKMWINYQKAGEYNPPHNHTGDLAFIIYLDIPKEISKEKAQDSSSPGNLIFEYGERHFQNFISFNNSCANITPMKGQVIIFPAWLSHHVYSFNSKNVERVSVSGNIRIQHHHTPFF